MGKVFALLIGIDSYPAGTCLLEGCVNDVDGVEEFLPQHYSDLALLKLTNADETYANVIALIRAHLGQAGKDGVVAVGVGPDSPPRSNRWYPVRTSSPR